MLKNIPSNLSPDLLKILCEMGHSDELVIADGNFPSASMGQRVIRYDASDIPELLDSILKLYPLDQYVEKPVGLMECPTGEPEIWKDYKKIIKENTPVDEKEPKIEAIERFEFYKRAKKAYVVIATKEKALYANIILKKGVIK
jgi:L-fucose mutarotase